MRRDRPFTARHHSGKQRLLPAGLTAGYSVDAGVQDTPAAGVQTVLDRPVAEARFFCLWPCEQPSLVDCEPSSYSVHDADSEAGRLRVDKTLFVDENLRMRASTVQTSRVSES